MPKQGLTHIVAVIDRSGSMADKVDQVIEGTNRFFADQQALPGHAIVTVVLFDHEYNHFCREHDLTSGAVVLDKTTFMPRGTTALFDALGRGITTEDEILTGLAPDDRPERVVVVIVTDGGENASTEYEEQQIHAMIDQRREVEEWQFLFLGADQAAMKNAAGIGIPMAASAQFSGTPQGVTAAYAAASASVCSYRGGESKDVSIDHDARSVMTFTDDKKPPTQTIRVPSIDSTVQFGELGGKAEKPKEAPGDDQGDADAGV